MKTIDLSDANCHLGEIIADTTIGEAPTVTQNGALVAQFRRLDYKQQ